MLEMQKENRQVVRLARKGKMMNVNDNDVAIIVSLTKQIIYPKCQYIHDDTQLNRVTKMLAKKQRMPKDSYNDFNICFRDIILKTINQMRNASVQSMRKIYGSKLLYFTDFDLTNNIMYYFD